MLLAPLLALGIGLLLGILGGGGSVLTLPLLTEHYGLDPRHAAATSLVVVCATAAVGVVPHALAGRVHWRTGTLFGVSGLVGGALGGAVGARLPDTVLVGAFAVLMLVTAGLMLRPPPVPAPSARSSAGNLAPRRALLAGLGVGSLAGMVGAGGGFLIVPALTLLGGLPVEAAVGTSLLVIGLNTAGGALGYLSGLEIDLGLAARLSVVMVAGVVIGGRLTGRIPTPVLRRSFAVLIVLATALLLWHRMPLLTSVT